MKKKKRIIIGFILTILLCIPALSRDDLKFFSAPGWIPFLIKDDESNFSGLAIDLMNEIAQKLGAKAVLLDVPWMRGFVMMELGEMDMCPSVYSNDERRERFIFTDPFMTNELRIFVRTGGSMKFSRLSDLKGKVLGKDLGASYGSEFDNYARENIKMYENRMGKEGLFSMLQVGRVDGVVMDYRDGMSYLRKKGIKNIIPLEKPIQIQKVYMIISKKSVYKKSLKEINSIINDLKKKGAIEKMAERYY